MSILRCGRGRSCPTRQSPGSASLRPQCWEGARQVLCRLRSTGRALPPITRANDPGAADSSRGPSAAGQASVAARAVARVQRGVWEWRDPESSLRTTRRLRVLVREEVGRCRACFRNIAESRASSCGRKCRRRDCNDDLSTGERGCSSSSQDSSNASGEPACHAGEAEGWPRTAAHSLTERGWPDGGIVMPVHRLEVFADYHQFYVWDAGTDPQAPGRSGRAAIWPLCCSRGSWLA